MSKFAAKQAPKKPEADDVPAPPKHCTYSGCEATTDVLVAVVRQGSNGKVRSSTFDEFHDGKAAGRKLREGYSWISWVARCTLHYLQDIDRKKISVYTAELIKRPEMPNGRPSGLSGTSQILGISGDGGDPRTQGSNMARNMPIRLGADALAAVTKGGWDVYQDDSLERDFESGRFDRETD